MAHEPQGGIVPEPGSHAFFVVMDVRDHAAVATVAEVAASLPKRVAQVARGDNRARLAATVSFGSELWDALWPRRPMHLHNFRALRIDTRAAPATGGDLFLHVTSQREDLAFELVHGFRNELGGVVEVVEEVHGFRYRDSRDLTGFIDGTENPKGKARAAAALIGDEDPEFAGGSYVFTQRYVHDLARWNVLPVSEQEKIVGRRKKDSKELSEAQKPPSAHIARVVIEENGEELQIVRHSFPYGSTKEAGLFFLAYLRRAEIAERMLRRMMGATDDGVHDRLMDYTRAVSGAHFFAPPLAMLKALGPAAAPKEVAAPVKAKTPKATKRPR